MKHCSTYSKLSFFLSFIHSFIDSWVDKASVFGGKVAAKISDSLLIGEGYKATPLISEAVSGNEPRDQPMAQAIF